MFNNITEWTGAAKMESLLWYLHSLQAEERKQIARNFAPFLKYHDLPDHYQAFHILCKEELWEMFYKQNLVVR